MFVLIGVRNGEQSWSGNGWLPDSKVAVATFDELTPLTDYVKWAKLANPVYSKHQVYRQASVLRGYDRCFCEEVSHNLETK